MESAYCVFVCFLVCLSRRIPSARAGSERRPCLLVNCCLLDIPPAVPRLIFPLRSENPPEMLFGVLCLFVSVDSPRFGGTPSMFQSSGKIFRSGKFICVGGLEHRGRVIARESACKVFWSGKFIGSADSLANALALSIRRVSN